MITDLGLNDLKRTCVAFLVFGFASCPLFSWEIDVLVYGATPGGIAAAVSAAKGGQEVLLVEPTDRVGGLFTCGLSNSDFRSFESLSGFFWDFSQRVKAVPAAIQEDARSWGLCRDEFLETSGLPPQLYIREARRMLGQHIFTGNDTTQVEGDARGRLHIDSIAIGDYVHNCHGTGRIGSKFNGEHSGKFYKNIPPYQIPYGVIVPQKTENLLVPVACSASHFGFGALRLEPIWCSLGQAAGWAASMALEQDGAVQSVEVSELQLRLHEDHSATIYVGDVSSGSQDFPAVPWF